MTGDPHASRLTDPESLRGDDAVDVRDEIHEVDAGDFEHATDLDSHVVVGVADDRGVLLQDDGHHGWTLPAFPVEDSEDWYATARREFEALTGTAITVDAPERLRSREYRLLEGNDSTFVRDLVVRASPVGVLPDAPESGVEGVELRWFGGVPDDAPEPVADDVALFVD